jgi:hypothetical protein
MIHNESRPTGSVGQGMSRRIARGEQIGQRIHDSVDMLERRSVELDLERKFPVELRSAAQQ